MTKFLGPLRLIGFGWLIVVAIGLGFFVGYWLDSRLQTTPLFIIVGSTIGVVTGFVAFFRLLTETVREQRLTDARSERRPAREHHSEDAEE
ncbi:MAG: AtpZ/AtpI family protein [Chloroflexi bacterium]|nr:AtpZ/AtpI family protein [Chloroflexota bacterium]